MNFYNFEILKAVLFQSSKPKNACSVPEPPLLLADDVMISHVPFIQAETAEASDWSTGASRMERASQES